MSHSEIERFNRDLRASAALAEEASKHRITLAATVAFAASRGYRFTLDEATAHAKANAIAADGELSDAALDSVAGAGEGNIEIKN